METDRTRPSRFGGRGIVLLAILVGLVASACVTTDPSPEVEVAAEPRLLMEIHVSARPGLHHSVETRFYDDGRWEYVLNGGSSSSPYPGVVIDTGALTAAKTEQLRAYLGRWDFAAEKDRIEDRGCPEGKLARSTRVTVHDGDDTVSLSLCHGVERDEPIIAEAFALANGPRFELVAPYESAVQVIGRLAAPSPETRFWIGRGRVASKGPNGFAIDIDHVATLGGELEPPSAPIDVRFHDRGVDLTEAERGAAEKLGVGDPVVAISRTPRFTEVEYVGLVDDGDVVDHGPSASVMSLGYLMEQARGGALLSPTSCTISPWFGVPEQESNVDYFTALSLHVEVEQRIRGLDRAARLDRGQRVQLRIRNSEPTEAYALVLDGRLLWRRDYRPARRAMSDARVPESEGEVGLYRFGLDAQVGGCSNGELVAAVADHAELVARYDAADFLDNRVVELDLSSGALAPVKPRA